MVSPLDGMHGLPSIGAGSQHNPIHATPAVVVRWSASPGTVIVALQMIIKRPDANAAQGVSFARRVPRFDDG